MGAKFWAEVCDKKMVMFPSYMEAVDTPDGTKYRFKDGYDPFAAGREQGGSRMNLLCRLGIHRFEPWDENWQDHHYIYQMKDSWARIRICPYCGKPDLKNTRPFPVQQCKRCRDLAECNWDDWVLA